MAVEKNRKKRIILVILAIVMVCCLIVIGTLAWLQWRTQKEENTFTLGQGVTVELKEEKYGKEENQERVKNFTPGMLLDKDPTVCIPETNIDEYIAVTVRYYIEEAENSTINLKEVSYEEFSQYYGEINSFTQTKKDRKTVSGSSVISSEEEKNYVFNEGFRNGWVHDEDCRIFYYGAAAGSSVSTRSRSVVTTDSDNDDIVFTPVTSGAAITLFDKVKVSKCYDRYSAGFDPDKHRYTAGEYTYTDGRENSKVTKTEGQLKGFKIVIAAYAVQGNITPKEAKEQLNSLIRQHIGG